RPVPEIRALDLRPDRHIGPTEDVPTRRGLFAGHLYQDADERQHPRVCGETESAPKGCALGISPEVALTGHADIRRQTTKYDGLSHSCYAGISPMSSIEITL